MKVENASSGFAPVFEAASGGVPPGCQPIALAKQLAMVSMCPRRMTASTQPQPSRASVSHPPDVVARQSRADVASRRTHPLGPTLGVDFAEPIRSLQAQPQYWRSVALMAEKLVDFANKSPRGWHFDLHAQAEFAMINFLLSHLPPRLRRRYENETHNVSTMPFQIRRFSRLFFLASSTPLPMERLSAYARRWMEIKTKASPSYVKAHLQKLLFPPKPHLSIPRDVSKALTGELAQVCGVRCTERFDAALFCVSAFSHMVYHIIFESIDHAKLRTPMHIRENMVESPDKDFEFATGICDPFVDLEYVVDATTAKSLEKLNHVALGASTSAPPPHPSAPPLPSLSD